MTHHPMHISLYVTPGADALARQAAELIIESCEQAITQRGTFCIALSGGSTPVTLFRLLAHPEYAHRMPWSNIRVYWVDERCVGPDHEQSNYGIARNELLHRIAATKFYRMKGEQQPEDAAQGYDALLRKHFALHDTEYPRFDCLLLGVGADGHTASLFPDSDALKETKQLVVAQHVPAHPANRLTLTLPVINNARTIIAMASGRDKHPAVVRALSLLAPHNLPIQQIMPHTGRLVWVVDEAAARGA